MGELRVEVARPKSYEAVETGEPTVLVTWWLKGLDERRIRELGRE